MYDCATELITPYIVTIGFYISFLLLHISSSFELRIHKLLNAIHKLDHHCEIKHHEAMWFRHIWLTFAMLPMSVFTAARILPIYGVQTLV